MADSRLEMLKQIAAGMAAQFGSNCEVVVHDLTRSSIDSSIVHIENGHITGRSLGDGPSAAVLNAVKHQDGPLKDHLAYLIRTENGRVLKCSTIYINDDAPASFRNLIALILSSFVISAAGTPTSSTDSAMSSSRSSLTSWVIFFGGLPASEHASFCGQLVREWMLPSSASRFVIS